MSMKNKHLKLLALALSGGILMWIGWPPSILFFFLFLGFVPFLFIEDYFSHPERKHLKFQLFIYLYIGLLTWNALTTYWIYNATLPGAIFAILANSLLMSVPLLAFHYTKQQLGYPIGYFSLILYWISFEYIHHQWEFTWSWLSLGNGLSKVPMLIQWYEYTGIFGGSLWILGANLLIFRAIKKQLFLRKKLKENPEQGHIKKGIRSGLVFSVGKIILLIGFPILTSLIIFYNYDIKGTPIEVVAVQPNIDPYEEKFAGGSRFIPYEQQLERLINLSEKMITPETEFVAWPETAIPGGMDINKFEEYRQIQRIRQFLQKYPHVTLVTGIDGFQFYNPQTKTATSREAGNQGVWYDAFNTAIKVTADGGIESYHKSKLVPGVERMPYPQVFTFLEYFSIDLGGISGSLGTQEERAVFFSKDSVGVAPVICFESIFGDFMTGYIKKGAEAIFVITNDGWWGNTEGHKQHLYFSSLRAIETRKEVARAANTGISAFVDQKGIIRQDTDFWVQAAIRDNIYVNNYQTFYVKNGDIIARIALLIAIISILITIISSFTNKFHFRSNRIR